MRLMVFLDYDNFYHSINTVSTERGNYREIDTHRINVFVKEFLSRNLQYEDHKLIHTRTYCYTGEYTENLLNKITRAIKKTRDEYLKTNLEQLLERTKNDVERQKKQFEWMETHYFFELRKKPLQFSPKKGIFQKGIDVQIAVDLVSNAFLGNYDIAVLFSGDIDLLESVKTVKNLGKHVIVFSHSDLMSRELNRESDLFVKLDGLDDDLLDKFTHKYENRVHNNWS